MEPCKAFGIIINTTMKVKFSITIILGLLTLAFIYNNALKETTPPVSPSNNNITNNFLIGSLHSGVDENFQNANDIGLNMWHLYTALAYDTAMQRHVPGGWRASDSLTADIGVYGAGITEKLDSIYNNNGMRSFLQRPKIEYLCYGQRSDYQCEDASHVDGGLFFYTFQSPNHVGADIQDNTVYGGGQYVRYCQTIPDNPVTGGMVVSRLKCNTEQSEPAGSNNQWQSDGECDWLIKPRIRIDSNFAHNFGNTMVCKVIILRSPGDTLKAVDIKAANFLKNINGLFFYNGQYLEEFFNLTDSLKIHGNWGNLYEFRSRGNWTTDSLNDSTYRSKVDLQVYWYGACDMWIDYVRVDNDIADRLLNPKGINCGQYDQWLREAANFPYVSVLEINPAKFQLNNLPCLKYVEKKMKEYSNNKFAMIY